MTGYRSAPPHADAFDTLAQAAGIERDRRLAMYPEMIASDRVSPELANADSEAWIAIAADWRRVVTLARPDAVDVYNFQKVAAIEIALKRARGAAAKDVADELAANRVIALEALHWHQTQLTWCGRRWHKPMIQFATDCNVGAGRMLFMGVFDPPAEDAA